MFFETIVWMEPMDAIVFFLILAVFWFVSFFTDTGLFPLPIQNAAPALVTPLITMNNFKNSLLFGKSNLIYRRVINNCVVPWADCIPTKIKSCRSF